jgi:hypothetical protein
MENNIVSYEICNNQSSSLHLSLKVGANALHTMEGKLPLLSKIPTHFLARQQWSWVLNTIPHFFSSLVVILTYPNHSSKKITKKKI